MTDRRSFVIPGTPRVLQRHRQRKHTAKTWDPSKKRKRPILLLYQAANPGLPPMEGPVSMSLEAVWNAPNPVGETRGQPKANGADLSNVVKLIEDALNGRAYHDDSQIAELHASKRYTRKGEEPHTAVSLEPLRVLKAPE